MPAETADVLFKLAKNAEAFSTLKVRLPMMRAGSVMLGKLGMLGTPGIGATPVVLSLEASVVLLLRPTFAVPLVVPLLPVVLPVLPVLLI